MPALFLLLVRLGRAIWSGLKEPEFRGLFGLVLIVLLSGAWFYRVQEGWSWLDSLYFTVITLTTVGYGDLSPKTPGGKIFTMAYILVGLGILSSFVLLLAEHQRKQGGGLVSGFVRRKDSAGDEGDAENSSE